MKRILVAAIVGGGLTATASADLLNDGNFDALPVSRATNIGLPAGAWAWPDNYVTSATAEFLRAQYATVPTNVYDPSATGNSMRLRVSGNPVSNFHLPNILTDTWNEGDGDLTVSFCLWVMDGMDGGSIYVGGDHGGGGFSNATDRGPQLSWLADGTYGYSNSTGTFVSLGSYTQGSWLEVSLNIDLVADNYDISTGPQGGPLTLVGSNLPFRSGSLSFIDRFTFAYFDNLTGECTLSLLDNVSVTPEPSALALLAIGGLLGLRRR